MNSQQNPVAGGSGPRVFLWESHAIISFLAEGSELMPADPWHRANLWRWLCFEQYNLEPNVATIRFWLKILHKTAAQLGERHGEAHEGIRSSRGAGTWAGGQGLPGRGSIHSGG
jgi:glutathione S-transferase